MHVLLYFFHNPLTYIRNTHTHTHTHTHIYIYICIYLFYLLLAMKSIESSLVVQASHEDVRISLARSSFPILPLPQKFSIKSLGGEFPPISSSSGIEQQRFFLLFSSCLVLQPKSVVSYSLKTIYGTFSYYEISLFLLRYLSILMQVSLSLFFSLAHG